MNGMLSKSDIKRRNEIIKNHGTKAQYPVKRHCRDAAAVSQVRHPEDSDVCKYGPI